MLRAVIYDLDGTLIDSRDDLADSVNAMLSRMGLPQHPPQTIYGFIGEGAERLIRRSLGSHESRYPEAAPIWHDEYAKRALNKTRPYEGIREVLQQPPGTRVVLTNKPGAFARRILAGLHLDQAFVKVVGGDEMPRKPAPDGLLRVLSELRLQRGEVLYVGDSTVDLATARAAQVAFCAVTWGLGERASLTAADYIIDDTRQLAALLHRLT